MARLSIENIFGKDANTRTVTSRSLLWSWASLALSVFFYFGNRQDHRRLPANQEQISVTRIDGVEAEDRWLQVAEGRLTGLEEDTALLIQRNDELLLESQRLIDVTASLTRDLTTRLTQYENRFRQMEADAEKLQSALPPVVITDPTDENYDNADPFQNAAAAPGSLQQFDRSQQLAAGPSLIRFELSPKCRAPF